jgi:hypothetical protein
LCGPSAEAFSAWFNDFSLLAVLGIGQLYKFELHAAANVAMPVNVCKETVPNENNAEEICNLFLRARTSWLDIVDAGIDPKATLPPQAY